MPPNSKAHPKTVKAHPSHWDAMKCTKGRVQNTVGFKSQGELGRLDADEQDDDEDEQKKRPSRGQTKASKPRVFLLPSEQLKSLLLTPAQEEKAREALLKRIAAAEARNAEMQRRQEEMDKLIREMNAQKE